MKHLPNIFHEASTKYSPQCTKQFPYGTHALRKPQYFHKPSLAEFSHFILEPLLFVASPFYPQQNSQTSPQTINTTLINSKKPSCAIFFCFIENSFFQKPPKFSPHCNFPPISKVIDNLFLKKNLGFMGIIYKKFLLLTATLFLQIGTSQNHPLKIPSSRS